MDWMDLSVGPFQVWDFKQLLVESYQLLFQMTVMEWQAGCMAVSVYGCGKFLLEYGARMSHKSPPSIPRRCLAGFLRRHDLTNQKTKTKTKTWGTFVNKFPTLLFGMGSVTSVTFESGGQLSGVHLIVLLSPNVTFNIISSRILLSTIFTLPILLPFHTVL